MAGDMKQALKDEQNVTRQKRDGEKAFQKRVGKTLESRVYQLEFEFCGV